MNDTSTIPENAQVEAQDIERHIPIYLLLDTSYSMEGAPIQALQTELPRFQKQVSENPIARSTARIGLILFGDDANLVTNGLVPIDTLEFPPLRAKGVTRLDRAFQTLRQSMDTHVKKPILHKQRGDGRPVVIIFTDGNPTDERGELSDNWREPRASVLSDQIGGSATRGTVRLYDIYVMGCGTEPNEQILKDISTGLAFRVEQNKEGYNQFIKFATMVSILSAQKQSKSAPVPADGSNNDQLIQEDDLPPDLIQQRIP